MYSVYGILVMLGRYRRQVFAEQWERITSYTIIRATHFNVSQYN